MIEIKQPIDISVVVPVHNVEDYLEECLNSLHNQTLKTAEFIVIDDGSTDHCAEICDRYAQLDKRFIVAHQDCQGTLLTRKRAFELARGKWCVCVDGDDYLPFDTVLEVEVNLANKHDVDILRFDMSAFAENEEAVKNYFNFRKEWVGLIETPLEIIRAIYENGTVGWGMADKIYRTAIVKKAIQHLENVYLISGTDCYQLFLICFYANIFKSVKTEPLYSYRMGCGVSTAQASSEKFGPRSQILKVPKFLTSFLLSQAKYEEYDSIIRKLADRLIDPAIYVFNSIPDSEEINSFDCLFCNPEIKSEVIAALQKFYSNDSALLARKASKSSLLQAQKRRIKRVGILYPKLSNGESLPVVLRQASQFRENGFEVVLFTEEISSIDYTVTKDFPIVVLPRRGEDKRIRAFEKVLIDNRIDLVIYYAANSPELLFDLLTVKLSRRFFVIYQHENSRRQLTQNDPFFKQLIHTYKLADSFVVLSSMEQFYYRSHGINAINISNSLNTSGEKKRPLQDIADSQVSLSMHHHRLAEENRTRHVVWLGRLDNKQKGYEEALEIFSRVCTSEQNVICHVMGKATRETDVEYVKNFISQRNLRDKIIYEEFTLESEHVLKAADVHLLTSSCECLPMSLAHMISYAVPTVLYELPDLEVLKNKKDCISVPKHNVAEAARGIGELLRDDERRKQLTLVAKSPIKDFIATNPSHIEGWLKLISSLENRDSYQFLPVNQDVIGLVDLITSYCQGEINRYKDEILRYQNLAKQYEEENNRLQALIESHQKEVKNSQEKIGHLQKQHKSIQDELLCHQEHIAQLNLLRKTDYDELRIERYDVCRGIFTKFCPTGTRRNVVVKEIAEKIYSVIKRSCSEEINRNSQNTVGGGK